MDAAVAACEYESVRKRRKDGRMPPPLHEFSFGCPVYPQAQAFTALDAFINDQQGPDALAAFYEELRNVVSTLDTGPVQRSDNYGPFTGDVETSTHWDADWTNADGTGGAFWPYLDSVNVFELLARGLAASIKVAVSGKQHETVWMPFADVPDGDLDAGQQAALFKVGVHEMADRVQLVIFTPAPPS